MWPEYNWLANPVSICAREWVPQNPRGIRWSLWPLTFEMHIGDQEPDLRTGGALARPRVVRWLRVHRTDTPRGWHQGTHPWRVDAYHTLGPDYVSKWNKSSRRDLRLWQEKHAGKTHTIEPVSWADYEAAYRNSTVIKKIGDEQLKSLGRKIGPGGPELWGVRDLANGKIVAGTALHYSPTYKSSMREGPFILPEARDCFAMTGLMDFWFSSSLARGVELQVFSYFAHPGTPKDYAGFSAFKRQFGIIEVAYPPHLWRLVGGKIF